MRVAVLGSGSRGNALVVESAGRTLLLDAGFSRRQLGRRLAAIGGDLAQVEAVLFTHEHSDHVCGGDVLLRRHQVVGYATAGTLAGAGFSAEAAAKVHTVRSGEPFEAAGFRVEAFGLPHDAREPVGYTIEDAAGRRLGVVADLGARTQLAWARLREVDCLVLETNHDLQMLRDGPYPWVVKQRIAGRHGHLSNHEAALGLPDLVSDRLGRVVLYHLSQTNNLAPLAAQAVGEALDRLGSRAEVVVSRQDEPLPWMKVGPPPGQASLFAAPRR